MCIMIWPHGSQNEPHSQQVNAVAHNLCLCVSAKNKHKKSQSLPQLTVKKKKEKILTNVNSIHQAPLCKKTPLLSARKHYK